MEKFCRFVDADFRIKFFIEDGGRISINGEIHTVNYVDDYYVLIDNQEKNILEFAHDKNIDEVIPISGAMLNKHEWEHDKHYDMAYVPQWDEFILIAPYTCNKIDIPGFYTYEYGHVEEQPDMLVIREHLNYDIVGTIFTDKVIDTGRACYLRNGICSMDQTMKLDDFIKFVSPINFI